MKKLKLIYNPYAGDKNFKFAIDGCVDIFQTHDYQVHLYRTQGAEDTAGITASLTDDYQGIVVSGGDGTVNQTVNAMMRRGLKAPLGVIPSGTANDFANYLKMPPEPQDAAQAMMDGRVIKADLGRANDRYFINVCGAGLFTNISQQVDKQFKDSLGKMAYYLKGIEQLPSFEPFPVRIISEEQIIEDEIFLFTALNGGGAGGLERVSPQARIDDGMLDFIVVKAASLVELAGLLVNLLKGDFIKDERVVFMRGARFTVEYLPPDNDQALDAKPMYNETSVDGEQGPDMPVRIECLPEAISLFVPEAYR